MTQALYRKWRSQTFDEVVGQEHVVRTLKNALAQGRIAHAYLFAGPRGTGKTTMARLLAKAVNCLAEDGPKPCNQCAVCQALNEGRLLDLIEIDGASNRGIDEVRTLREQVNFSPNVARYKVYIIDEVHMLTSEAFNALLKTLEEPPAHVIFVLATTEPHKLPPTIISRCQRFDFRRIPLDLIVGHLRRIAEAEGLNVTLESVEIIARSATGSLRDAISLLDQLSAYGSETIDGDLVQAMLGAVSVEPLAQLVDHITQEDLKSALSLLSQLVDGGLDPRQLTSELLDYMRDLLQVKAGNAPSLVATAPIEGRMRAQVGVLSTDDILRIARLLSQAILDIKGNVLSQLPLELAITEAILKPELEVVQPAVAPTAPPRVAPSRSTARTARVETAKPVVSARQASPEPEPTAASEQADSTAVAVESSPELDLIRSRWADIVDGMRNYNPRPLALSTQALLRSAVPMEVRSGVIVLGFPSDFHKNKVSETATKALVEKVIAEALGFAECSIRCITVPPQELKAASEAASAGAQRKSEGRVQAAGSFPDHLRDPLIDHAVENLKAVPKEIVPLDEVSTSQEEE